MSVEAVRTAGVSRGKEATESHGARRRPLGWQNWEAELPGLRESRSCPGSEGEARRTAERGKFLKFILKTIASLG